MRFKNEGTKIHGEKKYITKLKQFDWMVNEGDVFKYLLNMGK